MNAKYITSAIPVVLPGDSSERLACLFDDHHERLYRLARRISPSRDDALDLVQETFLRAARSSMSIPLGLASEEAWLVRVLINIQRDQWRKNSVRDRHDSELFAVEPVAGNAPNPEESLIARHAVWQALDVLSPRRRSIVVMHELEGMDPSAIAALLGISAITVRWHLALGKRDLARVLTVDKGGS
jgi:RNA polymerase sigma-70 factor (ECF subfamily)